MKNIAIFRSLKFGKSTLAKMVSKKYPNYHIIIVDDIRYAFKMVLPNNNINSRGGSGTVDDFPNFLACLFYKSIKRDKDEINYIIETCNMSPQKAHELFSQDNTILLFLGTPQLSIQQHFSEIRKYETQRDWTYTKTDEAILASCHHWISKSKEYEKQCKELNIGYIDTSFNRYEILNSTFKK